MTPPKWPKFFNLLETREIEHGVYQNACGTKHCAVGAVAVAFGVSPYPDHNVWDEASYRYVDSGRDGWAQDTRGGLTTVAPIGSPMHRFARRFALELGANPEDFDAEYACRGLRALEDVFEFGAYRKYGSEPSRKETAEAFNRAVRKSGYTRTLNR